MWGSFLGPGGLQPHLFTKPNHSLLLCTFLLASAKLTFLSSRHSFSDSFHFFFCLPAGRFPTHSPLYIRLTCLLYTSDAADERSSVDLGGRRIIKKKKNFFFFYFFFFFFFQAEDGIRDAQESRGLGDVYKRQLPAGRFPTHSPLYIRLTNRLSYILST